MTELLVDKLRFKAAFKRLKETTGVEGHIVREFMLAEGLKR